MNLLLDFLAGIVNGLREVWAHKFRSFLSMIGIILGVAALVAMVGVVQGMIGNVRIYFESTGGITRLYVEDREPPEEQQAFAHLSPGRTYQDALAVMVGSPLARIIDPVVNLRWTRYQYQRNNTWAPLRGVLPEKLEVLNQAVGEGRFISDLDIEHASMVVVLGSDVSSRLFSPNEPAVGKKIRLGQNTYTVIGVMEAMGGAQATRGRNPFRFMNRVAYVPITTAMKRIQGNESLQELNVHIHDVAYMEDAIEQLENILLQTHRGVLDFEIRTMEEQLAEFQKMEKTFTFALGGVAGISLLIGGIGIMNVMLAVINERIREIGVRKAIGARGYDIFIQFLAESVVISVLGGIIGVIASVGLVELLRSSIPDENFIIILSPQAMVAGFIFSATIGVLSGIYPALKAANLNVIEALRYE